jgi:hypothetical protein
MILSIAFVPVLRAFEVVAMLSNLRCGPIKLFLDEESHFVQRKERVLVEFIEVQPYRSRTEMIYE